MYPLPLSGIPGLLVRLAHEATEKEESYPVPRDMEIESRLAALDSRTLASNERPGVPSSLTCPECKGPLWEMHDGDLMRFRCRQGHAYSSESMMEGHMDGAEDALWTAINLLDENTLMMRKLAGEARRRKLKYLAARFDERLQERIQQAELLRQVVLNGRSTATALTNVTAPGDLEAAGATPAEKQPASDPHES